MSDPGVLRVLSLNIWNMSEPWHERQAEILAWVDQLAPNLVCLQEVLEAPAGGNQARWLADAAGGSWHVAWAGAPASGDLARDFGNAVLSRWPIDRVEAIELPRGPWGTRELQRLMLHVRTADIDVFCTHLNWRYDHGFVREAQVSRIVEAIGELADSASPLPPILCGDFNAEPDSSEIRFLTGCTSLHGRSTYFQDAWRVAGEKGPGFTWDRRNPYAASQFEPNRRIDYVFVGWRREGGAGLVERAVLACHEALTGTFASDHFGVMAEVRTPSEWQLAVGPSG